MIDAERLVRIQQQSYERAAAVLRSSWPPDSAMGAEQLVRFLTKHHYCVLATVTSTGQPQARPVAFTVLGSSFWFATVAGARLRNLEQTPWVSLVVAEGDRGRHRALTVDGPVTILDDPGEQLLAAWEEQHGSHAEWAAACLRYDRRGSSHTAAQTDTPIGETNKMTAYFEPGTVRRRGAYDVKARVPARGRARE